MQGHGLRITRENTHLIREAGFVCGPGRRQRDCAEKLKTRGTAGWDRVADGPSAVKVEACFADQPIFRTRRLLVTEKTLGTPFARSPAKSLSVWLSTTPSRVTLPFFTMM